MYTPAKQPLLAKDTNRTCSCLEVYKYEQVNSGIGQQSPENISKPQTMLKLLARIGSADKHACPGCRHITKT
jgi:hypothetical protein